MRKLNNPMPTGGAPYTNDDFNDVFQDEIWGALEGVMRQFDDDAEGVIVDGCVVTANASNFDMTAGIVYMEGEFMRVDAVTNQTFSKYIVPASPTNVSRTFNDAGSKTFIIEQKATVSASQGVVQYIAITSIASANERRLKKLLRGKTIQFIIDGGGVTILTGEHGHVAITRKCKIIGWELYGNQSGSIVIDIWKDAYANYPPTNADSITGGNEPSISSATKNKSDDVSGWSNTILNIGDQLAFNVDSVTSISRVTVVLKIEEV